jgi:hypothetical protein
MRNTADVTGGKPIAVFLQYISGVSAINLLVAFYDGGKRGVLFFYFVPDTTRDDSYVILVKHGRLGGIYEMSLLLLQGHKKLVVYLP